MMKIPLSKDTFTTRVQTYTCEICKQDFESTARKACVCHSRDCQREKMRQVSARNYARRKKAGRQMSGVMRLSAADRIASFSPSRVYEHTCRVCGQLFESPNRDPQFAKYCPTQACRREAKRRQNAAQKARLELITGRQPGERVCGTTAQYAQGCRCKDCKFAMRLYWSRGYHRRKGGESRRPSAIFAQDAERLVADMIARGCTRVQIARSAQLSVHTVSKISLGKAHHIERATLERLQAAALGLKGKQ